MVPRTRRETLAAIALATTAGCITRSDDSAPESEIREPDGFPITAGADEWAQPHRDAGHRRRAPTTATPSDDPERRWRRPVPDEREGTGGIAVKDGRCYVTLGQYDRQEGETRTVVVATDASDGDTLWKTEMGAWRGQFSSSHGPVPGVGGSLLWIGEYRDGLGRLTAVAASTGERQWSIPASPAPRMAVPVAGLLHVGRRVPGGDSDEYETVAIDPLSGNQVWAVSLPGVPGYPATDGTDLLYPIVRGTDDGNPRIERFDPETGDRRDEIGIECQSTPVVADGRLYSAGWGHERVFAAGLETGSIEWERDVQFHHDLGSMTVNARYLFGGVTDEHLLVLKHMHGSRSDELRALDPATGERQWDVSPDPTDPVVLFNRPLVAGERMFVTGTESLQEASRTGFVRTFDLGTGEPLDRRELPGACFTPPIVANGHLYVACRGAVLAFA